MESKKRLQTTRFSFFNLKKDNLNPPKQIEMELLDKSTIQTPIDLTYQIYKTSFDIPEQNNSSKLVKQFKQLCHLLDQTIKPIRMASTWLFLWNLINFYFVLFIFIQSLLMTLIVSVAQTTKGIDQTFDIVSSALILVVLLVDILFIRWRVSIIRKGHFLQLHYDIIKYYAKNYLVFDIISIIILLLDLSGVRLGYFKFFFFVKYITLRQILKEIYFKIAERRLYLLYFDIIRIGFYTFFFSFIFGAVYVTIDLSYIMEGGYNYQNGFLWMTSAPKLHYVNLYQNFDWYVWFEYGLFMVLQMVRGCGYGTPTPLNPLSQLWYNISALSMQFLFAYSAKHYIDMFLKYYQDTNNQQKQYLQAIFLYNMQKIPKKLRLQYQMLTQLNKYQDLMESEIMMNQQLSNHKLIGLKMVVNNGFINRFTFISTFNNISDDITRAKIDIAQVIYSQKVFANQKIFSFNQLNQQKLYFSNSTLIYAKNQQIGYIEICHSYQLLGVREFFINQKSLFNIQAFETGLVEYIEKQQLLAILKKYRPFYQQYLETIESIRLGQRNTEPIQSRCWYCSEFHLFEFCHFFESKISFFKPKFLKNKIPREDKPTKTIRSKIVSKKQNGLHIKPLWIQCIKKSQKYCVSYNF